MTTTQVSRYAKKSQSALVLARSIVPIPSSSKLHLQFGLLSAFTVTAIFTIATNASAATLTYFTDLASFNAASSISAIDDFESGTAKDSSFHLFTRNGNTFTANSADLVIGSPGYTNFGTPRTTTSILSANGNEDFTIAFGTSKSAVGFDTYTNIYGSPSVRIYGSAGLLGTYSVSQDSKKVGFFGVTSDAPITSIRWTGVSGGVINTGIDNLRTGSAISAGTGAPEPFTIIGTLVGGSAAMRMRKKLKAGSNHRN